MYSAANAVTTRIQKMMQNASIVLVVLYSFTIYSNFYHFLSRLKIDCFLGVIIIEL